MIDHTPAGWMSKDEQAALREYAAGRRALEIGAWRGLSTVTIGRVATQLISVDWWRGDRWTEAVAGPTTHDQNFAAWRRAVEHHELGDKVAALDGDLHAVLPAMDPAAFGFILYDADHDAEPTRFAMNWACTGLIERSEDGRPWALAIHDYKPRNQDLAATNAAVDQFAAELLERIPGHRDQAGSLVILHD